MVIDIESTRELKFSAYTKARQVYPMLLLWFSPNLYCQKLRQFPNKKDHSTFRANLKVMSLK